MASTKNPAESAIVITGASTGIGRAAALYFAQKGHPVFAGVRSEQDADSLKAESGLEATRNNLHPLRLDITDQPQITAAAQTVQKALNGKPLAGLVNNAGIVVSGPLECLSIDELKRQFYINVFGHIAVTQAFLDLLRPTETHAAGRIANISSIAGRNTLPFVAPYSASKFALNVFSEGFRMELAPWGIHVAIIEPGSIATPIWPKALAQAEARVTNWPAEKLARYKTVLEKVRALSQNTANRGIAPQAVVNAIEHALFAPHPKNRYLVGNDAHLRAWLTRLPDNIKEALILRRLRYPS